MPQNIWTPDPDCLPTQHPQCAGHALAAWIRTALTTPFPMTLMGNDSLWPPAFWQAVCASLSWAERIDLVSRLHLTHIPLASCRAFRRALTRQPLQIVPHSVIV
ncbi:hypothetical protein [Sulfobacillus thermosulfidooxidans]|uniref:hypothetical protein n=1 Tax=Sulfobacillus thermosulfidooxidans TaxID=28034 RepID=UPI0006B41E99|nr:hypothetical protein [Sulfobacillus thermosulfidooxidans]